VEAVFYYAVRPRFSLVDLAIIVGIAVMAEKAIKVLF
jgi:hypothetical protein